MKTSKILLIIQTVLMYLFQIPFTLVCVLIYIPKTIASSTSNDVYKVLMLVGIICYIVLAVIAVNFAIVGLLNIPLKWKNPNKTLMICKLILIPWYLINYYFCFTTIGGFLNPFLAWSIPAVIAFDVSITYVFMATMGIHSVCYTVKSMIRNKIKPNGFIITGLVFQFIFCLDVLGSIFLMVESKKRNI